MPLRKVHELTFLWFGLPGLLLIKGGGNCFLGSCGPGKFTEKGKFPKVLRGGCKRSFGPREQRSPKSLLHHPKLLLHQCQMRFGWCKRLFGDLCSLGPKDLLHPPPRTFGNFPFSVNFPGPQLPKLFSKKGPEAALTQHKSRLKLFKRDCFSSQDSGS